MSNHDSYSDTGSPRTDGDTLKFKDLAVRPEALEGRTANCDTVSRERMGEGKTGTESPRCAKKTLDSGLFS